MFKSILVPIDGSDHAMKAAALAADLAKKYDAKLILLNVMKDYESEGVPEEFKRYARAEHVEANARDILESVGKRIVQEAETIAEEHGAPHIAMQVEVGDPASNILRVASTRGVDLIVMGTRGLGNLRGLLLGSVSHKVSQLCECTCMTVK